MGAPENHGPKVVAFEGEFAFTEGHAQELKTIALAQQVGKRLRLFFSYNNAGIDDSLIGGGNTYKPLSQSCSLIDTRPLLQVLFLRSMVLSMILPTSSNPTAGTSSI